MARRVPPPLHASILVLLVVLVSIFLGPRIYLDQTILVGDGAYYVDPSFRAAVPDGAYTTVPKNFLAHVDNALNGYPRMHFVQTALSAGEIPWWNPYLGLGIPGAGTASATFEPIELVLGRVVSIPMLSSLKAVAALVIGGYGMFLLVVTLGASRSAGVFAAVAFMFSGWSVAWLGRTNMLAEMWMPWLFWAAERVLRGGGAGGVGATALFAGLACLSSHPQTGVHILGSLGLYAALRAGGGVPRRVRAARLALLAVAVVVGLGVALVQLVPSADVIMQADVGAQGRSTARGGASVATAAWYALTGDWSVIRRDLPTAVMAVAPLFFGSAADETWWWRGLNMMEMMAYAGLLPLFFAIYATARRRSIPGVSVWLALTVLAFGAMYALPLFNAVNQLPVVGLANNGRLRLLFRFALVVAAAFGLDRLLRDLAERRAGWARWVGAYAAGVLLLPAAAYAAIVWWSVVPAPPVRVMLGREAGVILVLAALALVLALRARGVVGPVPCRTLLVALAFVDPLWHLGNFNPPIPTAHVFPDTPLIRFLKADPSLFRVSSGATARVMAPDSKLPYRLFDVDLFDVLNVERHAKLQAAVSGRPPDAFRTLRVFDFREPARHRGLIDLLNVKYVLLARDGAAPGPFDGAPGFRVAYDREVRAYENLSVLPRAFLADRVALVSADEALATLTRADFDPRAAVLLEDPSSPPLPPPAGDGPGTAEVTTLTANRVVVRAHARGPTYLVLTETNYRGWQARIDGARTPIYQANYLFRAVYLPPGTHVVDFTFAPAAYRLAVAGTLAGLGLVAGCFGWAAVARVRAGRARLETPRRPG